MDNFKAIYKILSYLEKAIDIETPDWRELSAANLGISETKFVNLLRMLTESGYVTGIEVKGTAIGTHRAYILDPAITLSGLTYLTSDANMRAAQDSLQGTK